MGVIVVINNQTFDYPIQGTDPGWGPEASDAFVELVKVVNSIQSPNDILLTQFDIPDNVSTPTILNGLSFDSSVRAADVYYSVYRISVDHPSGQAEVGKILLVNDSSASPGSVWKIAQSSDGSAGVVFSISDAGQILFLSSQIDNGGGGYTGIMKFSAKTIGV